MKKIFKSKAAIVWASVSTFLLVLFLVATILLNGFLFDIVCQALGRRRPILAEGESGNYYVADFDNKDDSRKNGEAVNEEITAEGTVLLKNENGALPLKQGAKISVFGKNSVNIVTAGSGSAAGTGKYIVGLDRSLEEAGFQINPTLWEFYGDNNASGEGRSTAPALSEGSDGGTRLRTGETPQSSYTSAVKASYKDYSDAALVVFSRIGGESWDLPRTMQDDNGTLIEGAREGTDHFLQLDKNETDLLKAVCAENFEHVIVIINSSTTMELGFLDDSTHYAYSQKIDGALWIGAPGDTGIMSLGKILKGEISPSGRTVDTFSRNFKNDPTWQNFGDNVTKKGGLYSVSGAKKGGYTYAFVDYEESIYVGYKYYETRAMAEVDGEGWYKANVVYPFGYGLSYTTFTQEIKNSSKVSSFTLDAKGNKTLEIEVEVKNTGDVAGKEVVQVYVTAPYTPGGIEKSYVALAGFAKTKLLQPNQSETVKVEVDMYYLASYDYADKNNNGFKGYELEAGDYTFVLANNSHTAIDSFKANLATGFTYAKDPTTDYTVENRFEDADDELTTILSRNNFAGTMPKMRTAEEKNLSDEHLAAINSVEPNNPNTYTTKPTMGAEIVLDEEGKKVYTLRSVSGLDYNDERWEEVLNRVEYEEMVKLMNAGAFKTSEVATIDKAETVDADGPAGFADFIGNENISPIYEVTHYCCEPIMAATFNVELLEKLGQAVGNEALVGNLRTGMPYSGWYAPGMNIHRSPFGGRVGEYFSEDAFLTGKMGAAEIQGAMSKGLYTMVKHFAANEQETSRGGIATWMDEQALREIYLRPFEIAVKEGGTTGMMASFNRIGTKYTGGDYRLLTEVLRNEWGFRGTVISDYATQSYCDCKQQAYAGCDLGLNGPGREWKPSKGSATELNVMRNCVKNILYTTANSNLLNAEVLGYKPPVWQVCLYVADALVVVGIAVWGFFVIRKALKEQD